MVRSRGFTLLEVVVVLAIVGILSGLALVSFSQAGAQAAPQNAAHDLSSALSFARERAVGKAHNVWLVVFPALGNGAYYVVDDPDLTFATTGGPATGGLRYATFLPPAGVVPDPVALAGRPSPVVRAVSLDDYPKRSVQFGVVAGPGALPFGPPFTSLARSACSFCTGSPAKGAILFDGEGRARFLDDTGALLAPTGYTATGRAASLGLRSSSGERQYLFAVSGPTAYASFFKK